MGTIRTVYSDEYVVATLEPELGLVRYTRTAIAYPSVDAVRIHNEQLGETLSTLSPQHLALLIDLRAAPPRNDEAFETEVTRAVGKFFVAFRTHAFLVKTAVGSLQVRRLSTARGVPGNATFSDEPAALKYLAPRDDST